MSPLALDSKIVLLQRKYEKKKVLLETMYDANYATVDSTPENILELNEWFTEELQKLEKCYITELKQLLESGVSNEQ